MDLLMQRVSWRDRERPNPFHSTGCHASVKEKMRLQLVKTLGEVVESH